MDYVQYALIGETHSAVCTCRSLEPDY